MAYAVKSICPAPGCGQLTRGGRCQAHRRDIRPSAARRGYGATWQALRPNILARDPHCKHPGCTKPSTDVDHIIPKSKGGTDDPSNLQGLCHAHHSMKTDSRDGGFGRSRVSR